jgi:membrane fusion protein (multidrug efflux system)
METVRNVKSSSAVTAAPAAAATPAAPPRKSSKRPFLILFAVAVVVLGGIFVYRAVTAGEQDTDDAQVASDAVPIAARVAGAVIKVRVAENQVVKKGDLLLELDPADFLAKQAQAEAELSTAKAQADAARAQELIVSATSKGGLASARAVLAGSNVGVNSAAAQAAVAKAALVRAEAEARKADLDLGRAQALMKANAVPQERLDTAQIAADEAHAALAQAKAQLALAEETKRSAETRVGEARGRLSQSEPIAPQMAAAHAATELAEARVAAAEAALALAKLQVGYTRVSAPADGVASKLTAHEGQLVTVGQPLIQLMPLQTYVIANFKETQIGEMRPGQKADIKLDAFPGRHFEGRVESLAGGTGASFSLLPADNATGNFVKVVQRVPVRIAWVNPPADVPLRAGLSADVTVHVEAKP